MVECHYKGTVIPISLSVFLEVVFHEKIKGKKFVRYKEGAWIYSISEREFNKLAHDAKATYKLNKKVIIKLELIDKYLEYFREL